MNSRLLDFSIKLENHILLAFKRFLFENRKETFIVNLNGFWKYLMHIQKNEFQIARKMIKSGIQ